MPNVKIPKEFAKRKQLIAVPEREYRAFRDFMNASENEIADVRTAEAEIKAGLFIEAPSADVALKEARARGWLD